MLLALKKSIVRLPRHQIFYPEKLCLVLFEVFIALSNPAAFHGSPTLSIISSAGGLDMTLLVKELHTMPEGHSVLFSRNRLSSLGKCLHSIKK